MDTYREGCPGPAVISYVYNLSVQHGGCGRSGVNSCHHWMSGNSQRAALWPYNCKYTNVTYTYIFIAVDQWCGSVLSQWTHVAVPVIKKYQLFSSLGPVCWAKTLIGWPTCLFYALIHSNVLPVLWKQRPFPWCHMSPVVRATWQLPAAGCLGPHQKVVILNQLTVGIKVFVKISTCNNLDFIN